jgi:hypothetical protein
MSRKRRRKGINQRGLTRQELKNERERSAARWQLERAGKQLHEKMKEEEKTAIIDRRCVDRVFVHAFSALCLQWANDRGFGERK